MIMITYLQRVSYLGVSVSEETAARSQGSPSSPCSTSNLVAPSAMNFGLWQISCNIQKPTMYRMSCMTSKHGKIMNEWEIIYLYILNLAYGNLISRFEQYNIFFQNVMPVDVHSNILRKRLTFNSPITIDGCLTR